MRERSAFRATLQEVGPDAPTACGDWTAGDLAVHVALGEVAGGWPCAPWRWLLSRGVRMDALAGMNAAALERSRRRRGFDWALDRLADDPPRLQRRGSVATVSLLEVWAHHDDVLVANALGACGSGVDLDDVVRVLTRYQHRALESAGAQVASDGAVWFAPSSAVRVRIDGPVVGVARWLSGRGSVDDLALTGDAESCRSLAGVRFRL